MRNLLLSFDAGAVLLFVAIGRDTHDEASGLAGFLETAGPFLIALALAWWATRAWRDPAGLLTGGAVALITVVAGMVLRRAVFDDGTAIAFIVVATVFLGAAMLGWRAVLGRARARSSSAA